MSIVNNAEPDSSEAMMLGSKTEVDMDLLYNALVGGAGSSR